MKSLLTIRESRIVTFGASTVTEPVTARAEITAPAVVIVIEPEGVRVVPGGTPVLFASGKPPAGGGEPLGGCGRGGVRGEELEQRRSGRLLRLRGFVPERSSQRSAKPSPSVSRLRGFVWKRRISAPSRRRSRSVSARRG